MACSMFCLMWIWNKAINMLGVGATRVYKCCTFEMTFGQTVVDDGSKVKVT